MLLSGRPAEVRHTWKAIAQASGAKMVTVLVTSFLLLTVISYAIYRWQRPSSNENAEQRALPPPPARSLFSDERTDSALAVRLKEAEAEKQASELRAHLLERASLGDKATLAEAQANGNNALYDEVLSALTLRCGDNYKQLFALVSHITRSSSNGGDALRVSPELAERFIDAWQASSTDRRSVAIVLHIAARADEAAVYQRAVETVYELWRGRKLQEVSAEELRTLFDGEYWTLSANTRSSGAGFVLKRRLAKLRQELAVATPQTNA
ncbi:MAG TPA: hypothetical protein VM911_00160 [Pyrinomonadaceae bacterium]|nr:hypothetical protein [Pyrinomonadaceae bacterium]